MTDGTVYSTDWLAWSMSAGSMTHDSIAGDAAMSVGALWGGSAEPAYITFSGGAVESWSILALDLSNPSPTYFLSWNTPPDSAMDGVQPFTWGGPAAWSVASTVPGTWSVLEGSGDATPEPGTLGLFGCGAVLLLFRSRNRRT